MYIVFYNFLLIIQEKKDDYSNTCFLNVYFAYLQKLTLNKFVRK